MILLMSLVVCASCHQPPADEDRQIKSLSGQTDQNQTGNHYLRDRLRMVRLLQFYGIKDKPVLTAMEKVRRHMYIPENYRRRVNAYGDHPCPIGYGQTISQPFIVAYMTEKMKVNPGEKVLEIGTGSGYQAAILAELGTKVYSIEIIPELAAHAKKALKSEGYDNVQVLRGDGYKGWPEHAPFDVVIVTCAPEKVPQKLVEQLKEGGRMILPVGRPYRQRLVILRKIKGKVKKEDDLSVMFVPMVHEKK
ncbi:MAG: protein-L-isoaspartate(D-aspartate) O-methyltransferase [Candidatus Aminicenantes bacterium]|nr:MAG: protein-L-isoaspartate(D-aspartate) O-methyltransferase [Candidatus Aminicenantes bacterium]